MTQVQKQVPDSLHHTCVVATWPNMTNGDEGSVIELANFADRSVQVTGDFGAGGNVRTDGQKLIVPEGTGARFVQGTVASVGTVGFEITFGVR